MPAQAEPAAPMSPAESSNSNRSWSFVTNAVSTCSAARRVPSAAAAAQAPPAASPAPAEIAISHSIGSSRGRLADRRAKCRGDDEAHRRAAHTSAAGSRPPLCSAPAAPFCFPSAALTNWEE
eukprot:scaffold20429_cov102-Isochrysis_galbana.AAC.4